MTIGIGTTDFQTDRVVISASEFIDRLIGDALCTRHSIRVSVLTRLSLDVSRAVTAQIEAQTWPLSPNSGTFRDWQLRAAR